MLLPSSRRIEALLGGASVEFELWQGLRAPRQLQRSVSASDGPRFESLLTCVEALNAALDALTASGTSVRGARLILVIADLWLIYDIVEVELRDLPARAAEPAVAALIADLASVTPSSLIARWQTIDRATLQLACAMPADALAALSRLVRRHRLRWGRVQGEFVSTFNSHRSELEGPAAALAVMRPQGTQIGVVAQGTLAALHHEAGFPAFERLKALSDNLLRRAGHEPGPSMRYLADAREVALGAPWSSLPLVPQS